MLPNPLREGRWIKTAVALIIGCALPPPLQVLLFSPSSKHASESVQTYPTPALAHPTSLLIHTRPSQTWMTPAPKTNHGIAPSSQAPPPSTQIILSDVPGFQMKGPPGSASVSIGGPAPLLSPHGQAGFNKFCINFANECRREQVHDFVISSGGIGPTHDGEPARRRRLKTPTLTDGHGITYASLAKVFSQLLVHH
ncbi:hypothetical protein B0H21DRAFT_845105 [Amylocystis lapponica]|nr:hypothetical protein B0H21DRAFT_845105 [Amylocystis lapponica]